MKRLLMIFLLLAVAGYAQDTDAQKQVALGEAFTVKIGEQVAIKDTKLKITFIAVPEDSRCPEDVECVWAGNAKLKFKLKTKEKIKIALNTTLPSKEAEFQGFKIKLLKLAPNRKTNQPQSADLYEATLMVTN
jgi:hypothetical protein